MGKKSGLLLWLVFLIVSVVISGSAKTIFIEENPTVNYNQYNMSDTQIRSIINNSGYYNISINYSNVLNAAAGSGNSTEEIQAAINQSLTFYDISVNCSNIVFDTGIGSAQICDGDDNAGGGGFTNWTDIGVNTLALDGDAIIGHIDNMSWGYWQNTSCIVIGDIPTLRAEC